MNNFSLGYVSNPFEIIHVLFQVIHANPRPLKAQRFQILHREIVIDTDIAIIIEFIVLIHVIDKRFKNVLGFRLLGCYCP